MSVASRRLQTGERGQQLRHRGSEAEVECAALYAGLGVLEIGNLVGFTGDAAWRTPELLVRSGFRWWLRSAFALRASADNLRV